VRLIHWNAGEAQEKADRLGATGYIVDYDKFTPSLLRERGSPPNAIIIDLSRLPSQGRDVGMAFRSYKSTQAIPLVFVDGEPEKVERVKAQIPDALYTNWDRIVEKLEDAIKRPPEEPPKARSRLEGYAGAPLSKKPGIKPGYTVSLIGAPFGFRQTFGELPENVVLRDGARVQSNLTLWFAKSRRELEERLHHMRFFSKNAGLWIIWPKQTSKLRTDLGQPIVREAALAAGMVDLVLSTLRFVC
jgi:hypothetical protein